MFTPPLLPLAMHIGERILPAGWAALWILIAACALALSLRRLKRRTAPEPRFLPFVALIGAAVFIISCLPIPIPWTGTCSHPCGTGLASLFLGPGPTIVITSIALLFQALLLGHGGLTTLGANTVSMGIVGALTAYLLFHSLRKLCVPTLLAVFLAATFADWATYATTALQLALALHQDATIAHTFAAIALAFVPTQLPLGLLEGLLTMFAYRFVLLRRPELLSSAVPARMPALGE